MKEMHCPLCGRAVRSDALVRRVCTLCGMGIPPEAAMYVVESPGRRLPFCSFDCLLAHGRFASAEGGE